MSAICARPGCRDAATTRFFFDAKGALVVLDTKIAEWGGSGVLCTRHADRLTVPRGWTLDDRRVTAPRLFPVSRFDAPVGFLGNGIARAKKLLAPVAQAETPLPTDGGPAYELPARYEAVPVAIHPDQAMFELPDERTPLLARAFESAGSRVRNESLAALIPPATQAGDTTSAHAADAG